MLEQDLRQQFISEREVLKDTKTPELLQLKLLEEVGELMIAFSSHAQDKTPEGLQHTKEETADVAMILLDIAIHCGFDLGDAIQKKIEKDSQRFPPETMKREPGKTPREIYLRRKVQLGERVK